MTTTYKQAGVSIHAGNELVRRIKKIVSGSPASLTAIGGFSGLFALPKKLENFYLAGCCDGVGTKLKIAFLLEKHDTIGIDLVAMNVNDLLCSGAQPLFFLDYFACGKLKVGIAEKVIRGIQTGCEESECILLGGETAEMPGFYKKGEYDLAGFAVGMVQRRSALDGKKIQPGDFVLGLPSSGVHANGFSLIRKIFSRRELLKFGAELLTPTRIYVKQVLPLLSTLHAQRLPLLKGIAHITGGGWIENIPRLLPRGVQVEIKKGSWQVPEIFYRIQKKAQLSSLEMYKTFNMGIGLALVVAPERLARVSAVLKDGVILGKVTRGRAGVLFV